MVESLQDWWSLAGVDLHYNDEPAALLQEADASEPAKPSAQLVAENPAKQPPLENPRTPDFPRDYQAFTAWLSNPDNLIERTWAREFIVPTGPLKPQVMVITALPEAAGMEIYSAASLELLENMLRATGFDVDQSHFASLALARPVDGQLSEGHREAVGKRILHYIGLVEPECIIVLGDTASKTLFGQDLLSARKKKQFINHLSSKTEAIATFHPRILLQRPELKAEAWRDLQLILRT